MGAVRRYWEVVKLIFIQPLSDSYETTFSRYIKFKYRQFKLKTNETIIVKTQYGPIKGVKRFSCWNDAFYSFEKIPFAKPPIDELRFKAPQPPDPWTDVVDCTKEGPMPLQTNLLFDRIEGDEDCLYLNVYTKNVNPSKPLPVMVWIYGGGFETGGTTKDMYSPDYFMQKNIVLISITYRVGPFGFLSLEDQNLDIPGNAGLKDQLLGLKWVKKNCSIFGGNPDNITVFGESAGAASTHYMMICDQAKNLFHKGVLMSGSAIAQWANIKPHNWAYRMANKMGYDGIDNDDRVLQFLRKAKGVKILAAEKKLLTKDEKYNHILFPFGPVIEPYITDNCIIPEEPRLMMQKAWSKDVPIIIGGVSYEGLILMRETKKDPDIVNSLGECQNLVPFDLNLSKDSVECKEVGLKLRETYFHGQEPNIERNLHNYLDLLSYHMFWHPINRTIYSRLKYAPNAPNYLYRFDYDSPFFNLVRIALCGYKARGTCHGDDLMYMWLTAISPILEKDTPEYNAIQQLVGVLTKFAETGNPNCPEIDNTKWEPINVNDETFKCLNIAEKTEIIPLPEAERLKVWDTFYSKNELY